MRKLSNQEFEDLEKRVIARFAVPNDGTSKNRFTAAAVKYAASVAVVTLQEYQKMLTENETPD